MTRAPRRRAPGKIAVTAGRVLGVTAAVAGRVLGVAAVLFGLMLGLARPAAAHPLDIGYLRIDAGGTTVSVALDIHVNAAARLVGVDPPAMDAAAVAHHAVALADATYRSAPITTPAGPCRWTTATAVLHDRTASIAGQAACPAPVRAIRWAFPFVAEARISPTFQILVKAQIAGEDHVAIADKTRPSLALSTSTSIGFGAFVWTGVEHIGAAPSQWHGPSGWKLPDGLDHILFLLALMLAGGSLLRILGIVSGFTLGHSITLALSALHIVRPPAALIEPLIALSIAFVAAEAFLGKFEGHRWKVASAFGLIHGFGFATALNQLDLSTGDLISALFGYNLGVELGQVTIVLVTAPLLLYLQRDRRFHPIVRGLAAAIFIAGLYWFFQRL
jgi:HupE / UreJ protein